MEFKYLANIHIYLIYHIKCENISLSINRYKILEEEEQEADETSIETTIPSKEELYHSNTNECMYKVDSIEDTVLDELIKSYQTQQETIENYNLKEELKRVDKVEANIAGRLLCTRKFLDSNDDFLMMKDERDQKDIELKESIASMEAYVNENLIL